MNELKKAQAITSDCLSMDEVEDCRRDWKTQETTYPNYELMEENWKEYQKDIGELTDEEIDELKDYCCSNELDMYWESFTQDLNAYLALIDTNNAGLFAITSGSVGWRQQAGGIICNLAYSDNAGEELISEVLGDLDCTIKLMYENENGKRSLSMIVSSHDAPTGNFYYIEEARCVCNCCETIGFDVEDYPQGLIERMQEEERMKKNEDGTFTCAYCKWINS